MNNKQFNKIKERLEKWRNDRYLTYENQQKGFLGNIFEEVSEYFRAKDDYERIDSLCDIAVFCFNAYDFSFKHFKYEYIERDNIIEDIISDFSISICGNKIHRFEEWAYKTLCKIECLISNLGFDFFECMLETIKEIESRTGYYNKDLHKFVKDTGAYTEKEAENKFIFSIKYKEDKDFWYFLTLLGIKKVKKWYKANYEQCKLRD